MTTTLGPRPAPAGEHIAGDGNSRANGIAAGGRGAEPVGGAVHGGEALMASRACFDAGVSLEAQSVSTRSLRALDEGQIGQIVRAFNRHGFAVVTCADTSDLRRDLLSLKGLFGGAAPHKRADADGIVPINAFDPVPGHIDSSHEEHPPHTDGAFSDEPERVLSLQCETPADAGGLSTLACAKAAFEHLLRTFGARALSLQRPDALRVTRTDRSTTRPVFSRAGPAGAYAVRFRTGDGAADVEPHPEAREPFEELRRFFTAPSNRVAFSLRAGQVLLIDNTSVVHGRSAFAPAAPRSLRRLNFDGRGRLGARLRSGFRPDDEGSRRAGVAGPAPAA